MHIKSVNTTVLPPANSDSADNELQHKFELGVSVIVVPQVLCILALSLISIELSTV